jgi:hypothetical protein
MIILSHRGYWLEPSEKNTELAFKRSFTLGYGTETDVRDYAGTLVISHDPPVGGELTLDAFLQLDDTDLPLALNIKSDGLAEPIADAMRAAGRTNWFVFDMSVPDTRAQLAAGNPMYTRLSEYETTPALLDHAAGVWCDAFTSDEERIAPIRHLANTGHRVCVVSPELHGRPHEPFWAALREAGLSASEHVSLCTDLPEVATAFFRSEP